MCTPLAQVSNALRAAALGLLYGEPVDLLGGPLSGSTERNTLQQRSRRLVFDLQQMLAEIPHANHPVRTCQLDPGFAGELLSRQVPTSYETPCSTASYAVACLERPNASSCRACISQGTDKKLMERHRLLGSSLLLLGLLMEADTWIESSRAAYS